MAILRPCSYPGCRAFAVTQSAKCASHQSIYDRTTRATNPALALASKIRSSHKWQVTRAAYKATHPLCCDPFKDHRAGPEPVEQVHHIKPLVSHPQLAFDWDNLRGVCTLCHRKVEAMERAGQETQTLFV